MTKVCIIAAAVALLCSCNRQLFDFELRFDKAYIRMMDGSVKVVEVRQWRDYDNSDQIQIIGTDGTVYLTHAVNVVLVKEK